MSTDPFEKFRGEPTIPITACCSCGKPLADGEGYSGDPDRPGRFCDESEARGWWNGFRVANATHDAVAARQSPWEKHSAMFREIDAEERAKRRALPWWRRILP